MTAFLEDLGITKVALCGRGMNPEAEIALFKSDEPPAVEPPVTKEAPVAEVTKEQELEARVAELETERQALEDMSNEDLAELRGMTVAIKAEEIDKSALPEQVRKALEEGEELRARVTKMEADHRLGEFVAKAKDYEVLGSTDDIGKALEEIDRTAPEAAKVIDQALKSAVARIDTGSLFKELGSQNAGDESEASQLIAKAVEEGLTRPQAIRKVFSEHPELYPASAPGADG